MTKTQRLALHNTYEKQAYKIIIKAVREQIRKIPLTDINEDNAELTVALNVTPNFAKLILVEVYSKVGLNYGKKIKKDFEVKRYSKPLFSTLFLAKIEAYFNSPEGLSYVTTIESTMISAVSKFIGNQLAEGKTIFQIGRMLRSRDLYKWQAMRIARTEVTRAMSMANVVSAENSNLVLEKQWIHSGARNERPEHAALDGVKVGENETFPNGMKYPGDSAGGASQVVNCRCSFSYVPKRNSDDSLIYKT